MKFLYLAQPALGLLMVASAFVLNLRPDYRAALFDTPAPALVGPAVKLDVLTPGQHIGAAVSEAGFGWVALYAQNRVLHLASTEISRVSEALLH